MRGIPHRTGLLLLFAVVLAGGQGCAAAEASSITLHFYERPPFMHKDGERAVGLTADRARQAFERADIPFVWALTPARRQLAVIEQNRGRDCAIGWFRTPERAAKGRFSSPIYVDKPTVGLIRSNFLLPPVGLAETLSGGDLHVVVKQGLTYGDYVGSQLAAAKVTVTRVSVEHVAIAHMISRGHGDLMFSTREEADLLQGNLETRRLGLKVVTFPDVPAGGTRHIYCSTNVTDAEMQRLNQAITARRK